MGGAKVEGLRKKVRDEVTELVNGNGATSTVQELLKRNFMMPMQCSISFSETRLIEIMENTCSKSDSKVNSPCFTRTSRRFSFSIDSAAVFWRNTKM